MSITDSSKSQRDEINIRPIMEWYFEEAQFLYDQRERAKLLDKK